MPNETNARAVARFTPGPWKIEAPLPDGDIVITTPNGLRSLCEVHHTEHASAGDVSGETAANARLIAQAPAMLEALQALIALADHANSAPAAELCGPGMTARTVEAWQRARAIVAAAKGESK